MSLICKFLLLSLVRLNGVDGIREFFQMLPTVLLCGLNCGKSIKRVKPSNFDCSLLPPLAARGGGGLNRVRNSMDQRFQLNLPVLIK